MSLSKHSSRLTEVAPGAANEAVRNPSSVMESRGVKGYGIQRAEAEEFLNGNGARIVDVARDDSLAEHNWEGFRYCVSKGGSLYGKSRAIIMKAKIYVTLKQGILDPQGKAIACARLTGGSRM